MTTFVLYSVWLFAIGFLLGMAAAFRITTRNLLKLHERQEQHLRRYLGK